jgi:BirA family transcriptional regulator, biotin operon repressor / biotin---[acetyl-CoA-carboxylase] ligase
MCELTAERIRNALRTRRLGHPTLFFERVTSTNDIVHARAASGAGEGLLVVADEQTAGRGRLDRSWWAPQGGSLLMSLLFRPLLPARLAAQLTMCLGLGAIEGIEEVTGLRPALKWPNDVVIDGRKLGGMLSEARLAGDRLEYAVLGFGLNVNIAVMPAELAASATSLSITLGRPVDRLRLLVAMMARCEAWYDRLPSWCEESTLHPGEEDAGPAMPLVESWAARLDTLGRRVTVHLAAESHSGVAFAVSPEGALMLRTDDGPVRTVWSGDIVTVHGPA